MLFKGTESECKELVGWLNSLMPGVVKFKFEFSFHKVDFLDLQIFIENGKLKTNIYVKPTNKQLFLDYNSNHPQHCKESIPYSQGLRVVERCTDTADREQELEKLKTKFEDRNYPSELLENQFNRVRQKDRKTLIHQSRRKTNGRDNKVRLIFTHNQANPPINKWIRMCKPLLVRNEKAKALGDRIQVSTKQPKNLLRLVGGAKGGPEGSQNIPPDAGCSRCNRCRVSCPLIVEGNTFQSTATKKTYNIRQKLNCDSDFCIYLATCKKCKGQYVGKAKTSFKKRHSNHKQEVKKDIGGLGHHYGGRGGCGYENMTVQIIEGVKIRTMDNLAKREQFWQNQLCVFAENGYKNHCLRKEFF